MKQDHELLMQSLGRFYSVGENIRTVVEVSGGKSDISLRVIDWFVTNFAKKKGVIHKRKTPAPRDPGRAGEGASDPAGGRTAQLKPGPDDVSYFSVYLSYRDELRYYSKQQFDPFRRNEHIEFRYGDGQCLETTVGQLNFFRWAIENGVLDYIRSHRKEVEESMTSKGGKKAPQDAKNPPETGLSRAKSESNSSGAATVSKSAPPADLKRRGRRPPVVLSRRSVISFD